MYKTQISCLIIVFFIGVFFFASAKQKNRSSKWFSILLSCSFLQLIFDAVSLYTVNHLQTVHPVINRMVHIFFMGLMLAVFYIAYKYLETIIEEEIGRQIKRYNFSLIPFIVTLLGVVFLPLSYIETPKGNYSYGPAAFMTYIGVAVYVFFIIRLMLQYGKNLPSKKKRAIYIALISEIPIAIYQILVPLALITCLGMVLLNLGIYLTTENPDALLVEQLKREKARADTANKAKTSFLANMSHEIRTPINAVLGMNELILRESKENAIKQYAKNIEVAAKTLLSIINDILDITKIEAGKISVISAEYDFKAMIKDVINMISFKTNVKNLDFQVVVDENIPVRLIGDDIRIKQILVNLLNNAVKYTHKGTITFEVCLKPTEKENMVTLFFRVKDTGIGIKEEDMEKLCAPFERIEEKRNRNIEGTGLGMSITKQLLDLLGSKLQISSVYGEGSEFSFMLCQGVADAEFIGKLEENRECVMNSYQPLYEAPNAKILLVDDNELNRKVFTGLLKATKIQIDEAKSGNECLDMIKTTRYDIIFLDHMMPDLDGVETFKIMKELEDYPSKNMPVVILTANAIVGAREKYLSEGFTAFLEKPIDYKSLEQIIEELLDENLLSFVSLSQEADDRKTMELPVVDGVDWQYARMHFNSEEAMSDTLSFFVSTLEYDAKELEQLMSDIITDTGRKRYITKVHSMKNSAVTVGIIPLAGMAKVLEDAGRNNNYHIMETVTPVFLDCWRSYKEKLQVFSGESEKNVRKAAKEHQAEIEGLMQQLQNAAEDMDIDKLDEIGGLLGNYDFEEEQKAGLDQILKAILNFDVEYLQKSYNLKIY